MSKQRLLISTSTFGLADKAPLDKLSQSGFEYTLNPHKKTLTTEQLIELLEGASGLIAGTEKITAEVFKARPDLKVISRCGVGMDNVDLKAAEQKGVVVTNTPQAPVLSVAELALGFILNLMRSVSASDRAIRSGQWEKKMGGLLAGKTVGIIGFGQVGEALAKLLQTFQVKLVAFDLQKRESAAKKLNVQYLELEELLKVSDVVSIHLPFSSQTESLINAHALSLMKEHAVLINTSRGGIVDEDALYLTLKTEKIRGAALDVFKEEPYKGNLSELSNVLLTSHIGSYTKEARVEMELQAVDNILKFYKNL